jgi:hypothetical protein
MSFASIAVSVNDEALGQRTRSAYAKEGIEQPDPAWYAMRWAICADPSIEGAYESALAAGVPNPGLDESVITDGALTAAVQAHPYTPPAGPNL